MLLEFNDFLKNYKDLQTIKIIPTEKLYFLRKPHWLASSFWKQISVLDILKTNQLDENFTKNQKIFWKEKEYWLLNRLDNDTAWFLYFAKDFTTYETFKKLQKQNKIIKVYYAQVEWKPYNTKINYPIMHKNKSKMIAIKTPKDTKKWRWKLHYVETKITPIVNNRLQAEITKWIRHQIRVHLWSINLPIKNDPLYWNKKDWNLQLYSVWIKNF